MHKRLILFIMTEMLQFLWFRLMFFFVMFYGFPLLSLRLVCIKQRPQTCLLRSFSFVRCWFSSVPLAFALSHLRENKPPQHFFTVIPACFYNCDRSFFILYNEHALHTIHRAHFKSIITNIGGPNLVNHTVCGRFSVVVFFSCHFPCRYNDPQIVDRLREQLSLTTSVAMEHTISKTLHKSFEI